MIRKYSILASALFAVAACGGGGGGAPGNAADAFRDNARRLCEQAFGCESEYDPAQHQDTPFEDYVGGATVDACTDNYVMVLEQFADGDLDNLNDSVEAGRFDYNADDYEVCVDALDGATCDEVFGQDGAMFDAPPECDTALIGTVGTGGDCVLDFDCESVAELCDEATNTCG